jgi:DNA-directed RNA polymerase subunit RPC12/RpoP
MADIRRGVKCVRCLKEFGFDEVRYLPDRSGVACKACLGIIEKEHAEIRRREGKLFGFQCIGCRYRFHRSANNKPEVCPQCGKREFIKFEKEKLTADNLLKIATDPRLEHLENTPRGGWSKS